MKRKLCFALAMVCVLSWIFQITVWASDVSLFNNNTLATKTKFTISDTGEAIVTVNYEGYIDITTGATITIKLEKRSFLLFWNDIVEDVVVVDGDSYFNSFNYQLENTGTYRCTVEYVVSGTGGADDVLTFEDTKTYG